MRHRIMPFYQSVMRHRSAFSTFFTASLPFRVTRHIFPNASNYLLPRLKCSPLKTCFNANTDVPPPSTPPGGHISSFSLRSTSTLPPGDRLAHPGVQLLSLLSVKLIIHPPPPTCLHSWASLNENLAAEERKSLTQN